VEVESRSVKPVVVVGNPTSRVRSPPADTNPGNHTMAEAERHDFPELPPESVLTLQE
jgi:hypothetical protein